MNGIMYYGDFSDRHLSLKVISLMFIQTGRYISTSFLSMLPFQKCNVLTCHFVYPSVFDEYLNCFHLLAIMNHYSVLTINIHVYVLVWTYVSISLAYTPRSGIVGSCDNSVCLKDCQTVFQRDCTI